MYSTCLFCTQPLGANEAIEHFPVGRRLAYDAAKGRLWVVCRKCERWNLTPLEERWEAIEEAERAFSATRLRVSTDNVGLARLKEGLELVRIGAPQRPELAAWRYGDQFGRRRRRHVAMSAGAVAIASVVVVAGPVAGLIGTGAISPIIQGGNALYSAWRLRRNIILPLAGGPVETSVLHASESRLIADGDDVRLDLKLAVGGRTWSWRQGAREGVPVSLRGDDAIRAAGAILPLLNRAGGAASQVRDAVKALEDAASLDALYRDAARDAKRRFESSMWQWGEPGRLQKMPASLRLALEMAAHEEQERRALEGELAELERAWQDAEEIAAIADGMFVGDAVERRLRTLKGEDPTT